MCPVSKVFFFYKVFVIVGGGSVIHGAYPVWEVFWGLFLVNTKIKLNEDDNLISVGQRMRRETRKTP